MKTLSLSIAAFICLMLIPSQHSHAQDSGEGLGIIVGNPTGVSFKTWLSGSSALDLAAAWSLNDDRLLVQASYLWHDFDLINVESGKLVLYYGVGAAVVFADDVGMAARVPVGLTYMFQSAPFDIFAEIAPGLLLVPDTDFRIGAAAGVRFWFD